MATTYPASKQTFTDPIGSNTLDSPDHATLHTNLNDTIEAIEDTVGTTAGTNVLMSFAAGQFPVRNTGGGATGTLVQTLVGGTISTSTINNTTFGTPAVTGGTVNNATLGTPTLNTPTIQGWDGWIDPNETWTFASASTFTIAGVDRTSRYTKGTRLKFTQTTVKYAVVVASSFSTNTTVTIAVNTDYTIANAAITSPFYSYGMSPQGYPDWFNFTTTWTGFSVNPTGVTCKYRIDGRTCTITIQTSGTGTSNATTLAFTGPVTAAVSTFLIAWMRGFDNDAQLSTPSQAQTTATSATIDVWKTNYQGTWTASGGKTIAGVVIYEF